MRQLIFAFGRVEKIREPCLSGTGRPKVSRPEEHPWYLEDLRYGFVFPFSLFLFPVSICPTSDPMIGRRKKFESIHGPPSSQYESRTARSFRAH